MLYNTVTLIFNNGLLWTYFYKQKTWSCDRRLGLTFDQTHQSLSCFFSLDFDKPTYFYSHYQYFLIGENCLLFVIFLIGNYLIGSISWNLICVISRFLNFSLFKCDFHLWNKKTNSLIILCLKAIYLMSFLNIE